MQPIPLYNSFAALAAANGTSVNSVFSLTNNSEEGFQQLVGKISEFKRNTAHGDAKAVSGTLIRRIEAAVNEIAEINDPSVQADCARQLLSATAKVEGGERHAVDTIRGGISDAFGFNPYTDKAKAQMSKSAIAYNARYADAMTVINNALDSIAATQNINGLRRIFNALASIKNNDIQGALTADESKDAIVGNADGDPITARERMHLVNRGTRNNDVEGAFTSDEAKDAIVGEPDATPIPAREALHIVGTDAAVCAGSLEEATH